MISKFILKLLGWTIISEFTDDIRRAVMVVAPHTSNWDFIIGRLVFNAIGLNVKFLIKKEAFVFPLGYFLRKWGGIPVDRHKKTNIVDQVAGNFEGKDELVIIITPEGTRSRVSKWKRGFYNIAKKANVPIVLGFLDYKRKEAGLGPVIKSDKSYEEVASQIEAFYSDKTGKYPEKFNLSAIQAANRGSREK